jgi:hypothetical protein
MKSRRSRVRPRVCGASPARWSRGQQTRCSDSLARTSVQSSACAAVRRCASTSRTNSKKTRSPTGTAWMCPRPPTAIRGASSVPGASTCTTSKSSIGRARTGTTRTHNMRTGAQVYQGLAGLLLVRDAEEGALFTSTTTEPGRKRGTLARCRSDSFEVSLNHRGILKRTSRFRKRNRSPIKASPASLQTRRGTMPSPCLSRDVNRQGQEPADPICAPFACPTRDGPGMWPPAHASKAARVIQLPGWLSAKRTAAFGSGLRMRVRSPFSADSETWQGQFQGQ